MTDTPPDSDTDPRLLRLAAEDNIRVTTADLAAGESLVIGGLAVVLYKDIPTGHKIAAVPISAGEKIFKYGAPIGSATQDIRPGDYVHTHNLTSDYLPTHTLDSSSP